MSDESLLTGQGPQENETPAFLRQPRLRVEQASYSYAAAQKQAPLFTLWPFSLEAQAREMVAILGANASGKSTLLRLMSGALRPLSGSVRLEGVDVSELPARTRAQRIALVQQESPLLFPLRVWEYVLQGRYPHGRRLRFDSAEDCEMATQSLEQVDAAHLRDRWMEQLSGGEKQRIILARALAQRPSLLLLDEPTQHLDIGAKAGLMRQLRHLASESRLTVILVTHELNLSAEFADRVVLLHRGKCLGAGTPEEVYQRELLEQAFDAPLDIERNANGRPRVRLRGRETNLPGLSHSEQPGDL